MRFILVLMLMACGGSELQIDQQAVTCDFACGGGTMLTYPDHHRTCTTNCGMAMSYSLFDDAANCATDRDAWLALYSACH